MATNGTSESRSCSPHTVEARPSTARESLPGSKSQMSSLSEPTIGSGDSILYRLPGNDGSSGHDSRESSGDQANDAIIRYPVRTMMASSTVKMLQPIHMMMTEIILDIINSKEIKSTMLRNQLEEFLSSQMWDFLEKVNIVWIGSGFSHGKHRYAERAKKAAESRIAATKAQNQIISRL